jgi:hypothetical protein
MRGVERQAPTFTRQRTVDRSLGTGPRAVARQGVPARFALLAVEIGDGTPDGPVRVRVRSDNRWTSWVELEVDPDHAEEGGPRNDGTDPYWVGEADAYEVEVAEPDAVTTTVTLIQDLPGPAGPVAPTLRTTNVGQPTIRSRASWGAAPPNSVPGRATDVRFAVVHHSVSTNSYTSAEVPSILRGIQRYHLSKGWDDIGYNFAVDKFGGIWEARYGSTVAPVVGAQAAGFNLGSVGIVTLGEYGAALPTEAATRAVGDIAGWKLALHGSDPRGTTTEISGASSTIADGTVVTIPRLVGHRDLAATSCPGANLYARLSIIRSRAATRFDLVQARHRNAIAGDVDGGGADDLLWWAQRSLAEQLWQSGGASRSFTQVAAPAINGEPTALLTGDFNGDGRLDLFEYVDGSGTDRRFRGQADGSFAAASLQVSGSYRPRVGDFDGNGVDDILWYGSGKKPDSLWLHDPGGAVRSVPITVNGVYAPLLGDFDGNGTTDVLWYGAGDEPDGMWLLRPDGTHADVKVTISGTYRALVLDTNADGRDDILWYGVGSKPDSLWRMTGGGAHVSVAVSIGGVYEPMVGDFDGSGTGDIFWYAPGAAQDYRWRFTGSGSWVSDKLSVHGTYLATVGDLDGDGRDDIAWFGPGGAGESIWFSGAGTTITSTPMIVGGVAVSL